MTTPLHRANRSARAELAALAAAIGSPSPGLRAAVDQEAATLRDSYRSDRGPLTPAVLAGYAQGLREAANERGWRPPAGPVDGTRADWVTVRLLAVCALAETLA
ncbi:DUF6401 family natural product biosynthesis protein [Rhizomonospora bruguierae]|uniref:DUF6401 family natural product biosynthesis protein n=1 Tax=Rhizomonospora bruguierae TaxID=1581705 RepID=UPI001BCC1F41|nr:DUF6401 family natural product biosynthesis protein [Micromonospora sp. NBRC 107566]